MTDHSRYQPTDFEKMIDNALSRRDFLRNTASIGLFLAGTSTGRMLHASDTPSALLGFQPVPISVADSFEVPAGYSAQPLISWGDPLFGTSPAHDDSATQPASSQLEQMGDNNDGMSLFSIDEHHALLVVNNEYSNQSTLYSHGGSNISADDVLKDQYAHGVSIFEIRQDPEHGFWQYVPGAPLNRRITAHTAMQISGPAAGHARLKTDSDPSGLRTLGTFGNCANGETPWGTYLTCEENTNDYFAASTDFHPSISEQRYGLSAADSYNRNWYRHDERFDLAKHPNEANRCGWVVEIDPFDPISTPIKRTALGRFSHENAALTVANDGRVVIYMGDDARGEHIYKFVSAKPHTPADKAANTDLLDEGTLYVAQFNANPGELAGAGKWLELSFGKNGLDQTTGFNDHADVLIDARLAATVVGATTMDRPEWIAVHPSNGSVLCTLTNNTNRGEQDNQPVNGPNPRSQNRYGQIVRWWPDNNDHASDTFQWDLFVLAGNPTVHAGTLNAGSANVTADNMFNGPDGLGFDATGRLWIQTDGSYANTGDFAGMGNNQMLCADPNTGEIRRFATGPLGCELSGMSFSPDQTTLFVGVQHPGEGGTASHFPMTHSYRPRSTIMMVRRTDGGVIGASV
jgi:secreted PhoX family phosphatase